jgi:hypothetical protein
LFYIQGLSLASKDPGDGHQSVGVQKGPSIENRETLSISEEPALPNGKGNFCGQYKFEILVNFYLAI